MGALPKRKISKARQGRRRGAIRIRPPVLVNCPNCGQKKRPHQVCPHCGYYRGEKIIVKREKKAKTKS